MNIKSKKNPVTAYAKSKMMSEKFLTKIKSKKFSVIFLRPRQFLVQVQD